MRAVNLIPSDQRSGGSVGAGRSGGAAYAVLALLLGFAVLAVLYGKASRTVSSEKSKAAQLTARAQQDKAAAEVLAPYTSFVSLRQQREAAVTSLVDTRFDWAHAFHELGRVLSTETSIVALSGQIGTAGGSSSSASSSPSASGSSAAGASSVSSATPAGSVPTFTLSGCATSQTAVAQTIQRLRQMDGVHEVTLQSSTKSNSGSGSTAGSGGCPASAPVFNATITYEPLPSASEAASAARRQARVLDDPGVHQPRDRGRWRTMTGRDRTVAIVLAVLVLLGVGWMLVVSPKRKEAKRVEATVVTAQSELSSAEGALTDARAAQAQYSTSYAAVVNLGKAVPPSQEVASLMYQLEEASNLRNVSFNSIVSGSGGSSGASSSSSTAAVSSTGFTQMPFTFIFSGGFFSLEQLFKRLTSFTTHQGKTGLQVSGRLLTIQAVKLAPESSAKGKSQVLSGTVTATAYVLPAGTALTGGASPAAPAGASPAPSSSSSSPTTPAVAKVTP